MGTVDDDGWIKTSFSHGLLCTLYIVLVVVCTIYSTTKDDMGKAITCRMVLGNYSITSDSNEGSWLTGTLYSIDGCCEVTAGGVLEADCHTQAAGKGPVGLALSGAGSDTGPAHKLICVLGDNWIKTLASYRKTDMGNIKKKLSAYFKTLVHIVGAIHIGIDDKAFPAQGCTRLLEICPHHY